mmetsp:Transcript_71921/g.158804  ORF Transcript_71921/g.158804 Transcript_71921/m.158804 type:complete len:230 (+) Transcript_71921:754-1443(+)
MWSNQGPHIALHGSQVTQKGKNSAKHYFHRSLFRAAFRPWRCPPARLFVTIFLPLALEICEGLDHIFDHILSRLLGSVQKDLMRLTSIEFLLVVKDLYNLLNATGGVWSQLLPSCYSSHHYGDLVVSDHLTQFLPVRNRCCPHLRQCTQRQLPNLRLVMCQSLGNFHDGQLCILCIHIAGGSGARHGIFTSGSRWCVFITFWRFILCSRRRKNTPLDAQRSAFGRRLRQ